MVTFNVIQVPSEGEAFQLSQLPLPNDVNDGFVRVKVEYAGVNHVDKLQGRGYMMSSFPGRIGVEFYGVIDGIGSSVAGFELGDKVAGVSYTFGSYAQYVTVPQSYLFLVPSSYQVPTISKVPHTFLTAFWSLFGSDSFPLSLTPSSSESHTPILIWGASTSVGYYAVQILKKVGYTNILAVASVSHFERLKRLGAKVVFDREDGDLIDKIVKENDGKLLEKALIYQIDEKGFKVLLNLLDPSGAHIVRIIRADGVTVPAHIKWTRAVVFFMVKNETILKSGISLLQDFLKSGELEFTREVEIVDAKQDLSQGLIEAFSKIGTSRKDTVVKIA